MRIGAQRQYERTAVLSEWTGEGGGGLLGYDYYSYQRAAPEEILPFVIDCFKQFAGFKPEEKVHPILDLAIMHTLMAVDVYDPYNLLCGTGNVDASDHWCTHTFDIVDPHTGKRIEAKPESLETFIWMPGNADRTFHEVVTNVSQGLKSLPHGVSHWLEEMFWQEGDLKQFLEQRESEETVDYVMKAYGPEKLEKMLELASWGAYVWLLTPQGQDFLVQNHDVYWLCATEGMAIIHDSSFIRKEHYEMFERMPNSCVVCGIDSWCVELAQIQGVTRQMCEHHLNGGTPLFASANCGTRSCKQVLCPHHPQHGQNVYNVLSGRGQLNQLSGRNTQQLSFGGRHLIAK